VLGPGAVLEARHIALLDDLLAAGETGARLDLPGGLRATLDYTTVNFSRAVTVGEAPAGSLDVAGESALPAPGAVDLPALGWRVRAWILDTPAGLEAHDLPTMPALAGIGLAAELDRAELRAYLDADIAGDHLTVRTWRPGDRFRPLGMASEKKLQDYFTDAKAPRELRRRLPLVFGPRHLLWVGGQRIDDRAKITPQTSRVLVLQLEPMSRASQQGAS
jgi:tRNA(Ile)-lysidine synthase